MKQKILKTMLLALLALIGVGQMWADGTVTWSADKNTATITPSVDGWIRETSTNAFNYTGVDYEVKHTKYTKNDAEQTDDFQAVMKFAIPAARPGKVISGVSLKLVTKKSAAKTSMAVYQLGTDITTSSSFSTLESAITTARNSSPIGTFIMAQQVRSKQLGTDNIGDNTFDLASWANNVALSTTNITAGSSLNLLVQIAKDQNYDGSESSVNKFFSSRATDITVKKNSDDAGVAVAAADLKPVLTVTYSNNPLAEFVLPSADRTCRTDNTGENGSDKTLEIKNNSSFVGLMTFTMPNKKGYEVESATLRLVFERVKGGNGMEIYPYTTAFSESGRMGHSSAEDATRIATEAALTKAKDAGTITTFTAKGTNKALTSSGSNDAVSGVYAEIDNWTNNIDITDYVNNFTSGSSVGLMIAANSSSTDAKKIFSKEAEGTDIINTGMTSVSTDLIVPKLIIVYKKMDSYELAVTAANAATLVLPFDATIPSGVKAYTLNYTAGNSAVKATEVTGGTLTANTPVLVNAEAGNYTFTRTGEIANASAVSGALTGVYAETKPGEGYYILTNHGGEVGFRKTVASSKVKAYRAYLTAASEAREFLDIDFSDGNVTAIKNVKVGSEDHVYYDLQGRRVLYPKKGLYIVNGKKVIIK